MITEKELIDAIRKCEEEPITPNKVARLADFYIIYDHLFGKPHDVGYSYAGEVETTTSIASDTEFLRAVEGKNTNKVWHIVDELMDSIKILHPKLYNKTLDKLNKI